MIKVCLVREVLNKTADMTLWGGGGGGGRMFQTLNEWENTINLRRENCIVIEITPPGKVSGVQ